jgi:hypothetical protein
MNVTTIILRGQNNFSIDFILFFNKSNCRTYQNLKNQQTAGSNTIHAA